MNLGFINFSAMTNADCKNNYFVVFNLRQYSVVSDTISLVSGKLASKWLAFDTWICLWQNSFFKIINNALFCLFFKFMQFFICIYRKFQGPIRRKVFIQDCVLSLLPLRKLFSYLILESPYRLGWPIQFLLVLPKIWLGLFSRRKPLHGWYVRLEHLNDFQDLWTVLSKTWNSLFENVICTTCNIYFKKIKLKVLIGILGMYASINANMTDAHALGASLANSQLGVVQGKAQSTATSDIPGFKTAEPPEASLDNGSIGDATIAAAHSNVGTTYVSEHSRERQLFKIDPNTDPMFVNANKATLNPEQTLGEVVMETAGGDEDGDGYEIMTCEEGGDEYLQKCSKHLEIKIRITQSRQVFSHYQSDSSDCRIKSDREGMWCEAHSGGCPPDIPIYTYTPRRIEVISEEWIDGCAFLEAQSDEGFCRYVEVDEGKPETLTVTGSVTNPIGDLAKDSEPIKRDSWQKHYTYACFKKVNGNCEALSAKGCVQISSECSEKIGDVCVSWRQSYRCPKSKKRQIRYKTKGDQSPFCFTGDCVNNDTQANGEMSEALSQLMVLNEAQKDIRAEGENVKIFKGQNRRCRKAWNGARDCCGSGNRWAVSWKLAPDCDAQEKELGDWRAKRRCVEVGTYCTQKLPIIGCIQKKTTFCCFGTKLSRLIQEQGRAQLGIGWGDVKDPNCRGLTADELSRIDMSKMNLSELYEDVQKNFKPQAQSHEAKGLEPERIRENMQHLAKKMPKEPVGIDEAKIDQEKQSL